MKEVLGTCILAVCSFCSEKCEASMEPVLLWLELAVNVPSFCLFDNFCSNFGKCGGSHF